MIYSIMHPNHPELKTITLFVKSFWNEKVKESIKEILYGK